MIQLRRVSNFRTQLVSRRRRFTLQSAVRAWSALICAILARCVLLHWYSQSRSLRVIRARQLLDFTTLQQNVDLNFAAGCAKEEDRRC